MIRLHRLSTRAEVFYLNPDLIVAIDSTPDTVVTLTTHQKVLVSDAPDVVVAAIKDWRSSIIAGALPSAPIKRRSDSALTLVAATAAPPPSTPDNEE